MREIVLSTERLWNWKVFQVLAGPIVPAVIAIGLGLAITIFQLMYFNDPTIVVR